MLRALPEGYLKSIVKNISSYSMNMMPRSVDSVMVNGISIKMHTDGVFDNKLLAKEVSGYNIYYSLQKGDTVIDAGAYTGLYTAYAAKKVGPKGKVIAYEPDPYNIIMLKKNIKLNKLSNVTIIQKGLFDKNASLPFDIQSIGSNIVTINHAFHNRKTLNKIDVAPLDKELMRLGHKIINFIKMDIEGAEIEAMKGAITTIKKNKIINLAIASYHVVNGEKTYIFLEEFFKKLNMNTKTEENGQLITYSGYKKLSKVNL